MAQKTVFIVHQDFTIATPASQWPICYQVDHSEFCEKLTFSFGAFFDASGNNLSGNITMKAYKGRPNRANSFLTNGNFTADSSRLFHAGLVGQGVDILFGDESMFYIVFSQQAGAALNPAAGSFVIRGYNEA